MSALSLLLAGIGQGMNNTISGVRQTFGNLSKDEIAEQRRIDSALLDRGMGKFGSILGGSASMAPAAFIPGANTMLGAGLIGTGMGLLQPSESDQETIRNAAALGLLGPGSIATGRSLPGLLSQNPQGLLQWAR